ncbi:MAG: inositol monophosphatase [Alphaproteobacteria bacterium]|nr:inositol monophosphatase [Alphaproteobacteria bacterium]
MLSAIAIERVANLLIEVADIAILPRFRALDSADIALKGPNDYVTAADLDAEARLTPALAALLAGSAVVGEEAVAKDRAVLDRLGKPAPVWIIDPLDGTANFAGSRAPFCMIVALALGGEPIAGWIYEPLTGDMLVAERGAGARFNGAPVRLAPGPDISVYGKTLRRKAEESGRFGRFVDERCAGAVYLDLARGRLGTACFTRTLPWDHSAGALAVREAGGHAAFLDNAAPYDARRHVGPLLLSTSQAAWERAAEVLRS